MAKAFQFKQDDLSLNNLIGGSNVVKAIHIPIEQLHGWENQPFQKYNANQLEDLVNSIEVNGLLHCPVVLKIDTNYYRILSGHNRVEACRLLKWDTIPCVIKEDISEIEAESILLDSNLQQRQSLSHKEKILAYSRAYALKKQAKLGTKAEYQDDLRTVQRYAQMGNLINEFIEMIDSHQMSLGVAYELSFLDHDKQEIVCNYLLNYDIKLTTNKARDIRQLHDTLTVDTLEDVIAEATEDTHHKIISKTMNQIAGKKLPIKIDLHDLHQFIEYLVVNRIIK